MDGGLLGNERKSSNKGVILVGVVAVVAIALGIAALVNNNNTSSKVDDLSKRLDQSSSPPPPPPVPRPGLMASYDIPAKNIQPESMGYDPIRGTFFFGSLSLGSVFEVSPRNGAISRLYGNSLGLGILGVYVELGGQRYNYWSACSDFPPNPSAPKQGGVYYQNMLTSQSYNVDLTSLKNDPTLKMMINDIVTDENGTAYTTNSFDGQIFKISVTSTGLEASLWFNNSQFRVKNDTFNFGVGLNGIEYYNGYLLVGITQPEKNGGGLLRINVNNPSDHQMVKVTSGVIENVDGLRFNADKSLLYLVEFNEAFTVIKGNADWTSAEVTKRITTPSGCKGPITQSAPLPAQDDAVYLLCSNGFGPGPYNFQKIL